MTGFKPTRRALALFAAPLALTACGEAETETAGDIESEPIAAIEAPEGSEWTETVTVSEDGQGFILGNPDAPLKLVEYASHTCGVCANFAVNGKPALKEEYISTGTVSFEQREVFLNTFDVIIAQLAQCGPPERMQSLSDEVWQNLQSVMEGVQNNASVVEEAGQLPLEQRFVRIGEASGLIDFFAARGLSADQARTCLADAGAIEQMVETSRERAEEIGVEGTPTFALNGQKIDANQWNGVEPILQRAGARKE